MKKFIVILALISVLLLPVPGYAQEEEGIWGEIQIVIDYDLGHTIILFLPEDVTPDPFINAALDLAGPGAYVEDHDFYDGDQIITIAAPSLIPQKGVTKTFSLDLSGVYALVKKTDLDFDAYLSKVRPLFLFDLTVTDISSHHPPLILDGDDEWEVWWKIPLGEGAGFLVKLDLVMEPTWEVFIPPLIMMAWAVFLMVMHKKRPLFWTSRWLLPMGHGIAALAILSAMMFFGWTSLFQYLSGRSDSGPGWFVLICLLLYFALTALTNYMKSKVSKESVNFKEYISRHSFAILYLFFMGLLLFLGLWLWPYIHRFSWWLGIPLYLLAAPFLPNYILIIVVRLLGIRKLQDPETCQTLEEIAGKLGVQIHGKFIVPEKYCKLAMAAYITSPPRILLTEYLWNNIDQEERRFILAHEAAHAKLGLALHGWASKTSAWIVALSMMLPAWLPIEPYYSLPLGLVAAALVQTLLFNPPLRRMELETDRLAISVTGNPAAAINSLEKLEKLNSHYNVNQKTTHPTMQDRITAIQQNMQGDGVIASLPSK